MAKAYFLTEDDHSTLMTMLALFKANKLNLRIRNSSHPDRAGVSPECYLAYPQSAAGIPGLSSGSTGTSDDIPGSAECDIFQVVDGEIIDAGFSLTVYNLSIANLTQDWIQIQRDKFGTWWAIPTAAVANQIVLAEPTIDTATGTSNAGVAFVGETVYFDTIPGGETVTGYVRRGLVFPGGQFYHILARIDGVSAADYEVVNPILEFNGYTNAAGTKGGTVNVSIYRGPVTGAFFYTGEDIDVECNFGDVLSGSLVRCRWIDGLSWEIVNAECTVSGT